MGRAQVGRYLVTPDPTAFDEFAIVQAQELASARLDDRDVEALIQAFATDEQAAFNLLVTTSRTVGVVLRPDGWDGGPIGLQLFNTGPHTPPKFRRSVLTCCQLIGAAARGDGGDVEAIALAVFQDPDGLALARGIIGGILQVLAAEPVQRTDPEGETPHE